jgi:hypothetical protein
MDETPTPASRTFTLRDLFVAIAVVAVLMGLWVAYLNHQRHDRIRRSLGGCRNQMKQLTLALQNHNDTFKTFPPLFFSADPAVKSNPPLNPINAAGTYSWQVRVLPFIEEDTLYKSISRNSQKFALPSTAVTVPSPDNKNISPHDLPLPSAFTCHAILEDVPNGNCNYAALSATRLPLFSDTQTVRTNPHEVQNAPQFGPKFKPDGMIIPDKQMRGQSMARMSDGTSRTAVLIESREVKRSSWYDPQQSFVVGFLPADSAPIDAAASNFYPYFNRPLPDPPPEPPTAPTAADWRFNPATGDRTALNFGPQGATPKAAYHGLERSWGPSSGHGGGIIMVGLGDGSVLELQDDVDPKVFFALITTRAGEEVGFPGLTR